jgi:hypothetical protein
MTVGPEKYASYHERVTKPSTALYRNSNMHLKFMPQEGRIANLNQLEARQAVRRELQQQMEALTDRRGRLVQERLNATAAGNPGVANEISAQITELSARINRLDKQWIDANEAIMDAIKRGVGHEHATPSEVAPSVPPVPPPPGFPFEGTLLSPPGPQMSWLQLNAERVVVFGGLTFLLLGMVLWRMARRGRRPAAAELQGATEMRQALDAIAVEVERISENQRYVTKLLSERLGEGAAKGIETPAKERVDAR